MATTLLTFRNIQSLVEDQLQEVLGATDMTLPKIKKYINLGYNDFVRRVKPLMSSLDITTVADQATYSLVNGDFTHVSHVRYIEDSDNEYGEALRPYPGGFANLPKEKTFGKPYWYWVRFTGDNTASVIGTIPIASTASETITVWGYTLPTPLSADSDIPVVQEAYHEALILYPVWKICNAYAHKSRSIKDKAITARNEYMDMIRDAMGDASTMTMDEEPQTVDVYGRYGDYGY
jgi:hypothetical protein